VLLVVCVFETLLKSLKIDQKLLF